MEEMKENGGKALVIASVASMLDNFNRSNIDILLSLGYRVVIAANFHTKEDINSQEKIDAFAGEMREKGVKCVHIDFTRKIGNVTQQIKSMRQVRRLLEKRFALVHCHSPICAAIVRMEAQKYRKQYGMKVFYTAHGFHFFSGAPLKNWLLYYPAEWMCSWWTDVLITINREDYKKAKEKFHAGDIVYLPGVGVDTQAFKPSDKEKTKKRQELGLEEDDIMLLSVGELNSNKNHELAIRALAHIKKVRDISNFHYYICGQGDLRQYLKNLIVELGLENNVCLMGYREDVKEMYQAADIFLFMSKREGLPVSLMEAMAGGLPIVCTDTRGNRDLVRDGENGFICGFSIDEVADRIMKIISDGGVRERIGCEALAAVKDYDVCVVKKRMKAIYGK